jgi:hypothetical protein
MLIVSVVAAAVLAGSPEKAEPPKVLDAERVRTLSALPSTDEDIRRALFEMLARDPERVVCSIRTQTGSRQPRTSCATLKNWFANRRPGEIASEEAPWQLVEEIKEQRKKALLRSDKGR